MKHEAIAALPKSGVNTLSSEGLAEVSTITEHEAAQVERATPQPPHPLSSYTGSGFCPPAGTAG
ncbi:MAG TPA: hypothetical protein VJN92_19935 [Candidatus Acidoferrum sp.]|nr:hypothetical protein [Candidatus Acidoferrum sp.]